MPGHGGRRAGAGRPAGSGWKPAVSEMREETIQRMKSIVGSDRDPLTVVVDMVLNDDLDGPPPGDGQPPTHDRPPRWQPLSPA